MEIKQTVERAAEVPVRTVRGFFDGFKYPFRGAAFVYFKHPGLVRYWISPLVLTFAALTAGLYAALTNYDSAVTWIWKEPVGDGFFTALLHGIHTLFGWLVALVFILGTIWLVLSLSTIIAAPFNDALSEEVEARAGLRAPTAFSWAKLARDAVRTVFLEAFKLGMYLVVMLPLFVLSLLLPVAGQIVYSVFAFFFTATYLSLDYIDWPASRRGTSIATRLGFVRKNLPIMLGFGAGVWLFLFIPFVNLLFMPAAVAGGTLLYLDMTRPDESKPVLGVERTNS